MTDIVDEADGLEQSTIRKAMWRLLPLVGLGYLISMLDRQNVAMAKLQMDPALGLSDAAYGFGAGIFFAGYFLLEVPSNLALHRFGARRWIARIMFTWGLLSAVCAFVPWIAAATGIPARYVFYGDRLLLGAAEAGFYPGIIYYLTLWFPAVYRARAIGLFFMGSCFALIFGQPLSGVLLGVSAAGLSGWQWLFLIEAAPAIALAAAILVLLPDGPSDAAWLSEPQRSWLHARLAQERQGTEVHRSGALSTLTDPRLLAVALVCFCSQIVTYGVTFFLPTIVKAFGVSNLQTGLLSAVPYVFSILGVILICRSCDRTLKRREHLAFALVVAAVGLVGAALVPAPAGRLAFLCVAAFGMAGAIPLTMTIPASFLTGAAAAAGLAAANAVGSLGGFVGPYVMGELRDATGGFAAGLLVIAASALVGAAIAMMLKVGKETGAPGLAVAPAVS